MNRLLAAIGLFLMSVSAAAAAQAGAQISLVDIFKGEGDPQTNEYLNMIFGPLFPVVGKVGEQNITLVSSLIANFNVVFFAIGLLLLVYNVIVAVTETAHDGSVLGSRNSSLWAPIRMIVAAACLIPLPTGYNAAQHAIAYVIKAGTATGTFFWDQTVDIVVQERMPVVSPDYASLDAQFLQALWRMELCKEAYNKEVAKGNSLARMEEPKWTPLTRTTKNNHVFISPGKLAFSIPNRIGACGTVSLPGPPAGFDRIATSAGQTYDAWHGEMTKAIDKMTGVMQPVAEKVVEAASAKTDLPAPRDLQIDLEVWRAEHRRVTDPFVKSLEDSAKKAASEELVASGKDSADSKLASNMKAGGWTQAGFYYQIIARFTADASAVQRMMPIATPGDAIGGANNPNGSTFLAVKSQINTGWFGDRDSDTKKFLGEVGNTYSTAVNWWNESVARSNVQAFTNERQAFADSAADMQTYIPSIGGMVDIFNYLDPRGSQQDPLIALMTVGNSLAVAAGVAISALALLSIFPIFGQASIFIGSVFGWVLSGTIFAGVFISYVLPLIPTIIWVLSILAFLLLVIEAVFAAPLWAIAHLNMDPRGGLSGPGARKGYVMLLALFLTPVMMLLGFLAGMAIFRVAGTLMNGGFYYVMTSAQSLTADNTFSFMSMFGVFATMVIMILSYVVVLERTFSFGAELPGRAMQWFENLILNLEDSSVNKARAAAGAGTMAIGNEVKAIGGNRQLAIANKVSKKK